MSFKQGMDAAPQEASYPRLIGSSCTLRRLMKSRRGTHIQESGSNRKSRTHVKAPSTPPRTSATCITVATSRGHHPKFTIIPLPLNFSLNDPSGHSYLLYRHLSTDVGSQFRADLKFKCGSQTEVSTARPNKNLEDGTGERERASENRSN